MLKRQAQFCANLVLAALFVTGLTVTGHATNDWEPIPPDELALKDDPLNPRAPAAIPTRLWLDGGLRFQELLP